MSVILPDNLNIVVRVFVNRHLRPNFGRSHVTDITGNTDSLLRRSRRAHKAHCLVYRGGRLDGRKGRHPFVQLKFAQLMMAPNNELVMVVWY